MQDLTKDLMFLVEQQKYVEIKREAYERGYKQAIKDINNRLKLLQGASEFLSQTTSTSGKEMIDVTLPVEVYEKLCKTK